MRSPLSTFYNGVPGSKELAEAVQAALNDVLNASPKMPEQTGSGVYLMATVPSAPPAPPSTPPCPGSMIRTSYPEAQTIRAKKVSDLKNRAALINAVPGGVLVSLHQNSLPTAPNPPPSPAAVFWTR